MNTELQLPLRRLKNQYLVRRILESLLLGAGVASVLAAFIPIEVPRGLVVGGAVFAGVAFTFFYSRWIGLWHVTETQVAYFLNRHYKELQDSSELLTLNLEHASPLERLQQQRVAKEIEELAGRVQFPHKLTQAFIVFLIGVVAVVVVPPFSFVNQSNEGSTVGTAAANGVDSVVMANIKSVRVKVAAPAYTNISPVETQQLALKVREGSTIQWQLEFTTAVDDVQFIFAGKDSTRTELKGEQATLSRTVTETSFYQLQWTSKGQKHRSDFYPLEIINDEAPVIAVNNLAQFVELKPTDVLRVELKAKLIDDYGLHDAQVIATVSKGSGESVKFREEKLRFTTPASFRRKEENASRTIDLAKLGLEPGDELYFYVEALDNKTPVANRSRTETFFIAVQDTANQVAVADEGLGVDLMPEYFRSQRQIIIDSEKLLGEKKKIDKKDFNARSNELGYDQKVLRLRYGQFLGEEFETAIARVDQTEEIETDVTKQFGHQHDTENEHNLVADKKTKAEPDEHDHEHHDEDEKENPFEAFVHSHDNAEEATFFIQSVKTKLRAALTLMWDAELYLRMYQPEQSLPYQYKILKLLKEISNDSRVYVHRTGFDPPPLKEEKRLSGDLSEVRTSSTNNSGVTNEEYPSIRKAVAILALRKSNGVPLTASDRELLQRAGNELAAIAIQNPAQYLKSLSQLRSLIETNAATEEQLVLMTDVLAAMWSTIKMAPATPSQQDHAIHPWEESFVNDLQSSIQHD